MNKYISSFIFALGLASGITSAQVKLPKWVTTPPQSTATVKRMVASGADFAEARHNAVNQLISMKNQANYEEGSYQHHRLIRGLAPIEQHRSIVAIAEQSAFFKTTMHKDVGPEYYVLCEVSDRDYAQFQDSLFNEVLNKATNCLLNAREMKEAGDLYSAAETSCKGLLEVMPMIHRKLAFGENDIVMQLHDCYLHSLDSIEWHVDLNNCPIVKNEDLPVPFYATAVYKGNPIPGLPMLCSLSDNSGEIAPYDMTDTNGRAKIHIKKAPDASSAILTVSLDKQKALDQLPKHPFSTEQPYGLTSDMPATVRFQAFDPTPYVEMNLGEEFTQTIADSLFTFIKDKGYSIADARSDKDIRMVVESKLDRDGEPTTGKYPMQYYTSQLVVKLVETRTNKTLISEQSPAIRLFIPANADESQIVCRAHQQTLHRMRKTLVEKIKELNYDKRKVVWTTVEESRKK